MSFSYLREYVLKLVDFKNYSFFYTKLDFCSGVHSLWLKFPSPLFSKSRLQFGLHRYHLKNFLGVFFFRCAGLHDPKQYDTLFCISFIQLMLKGHTG